MKTGILFDLDGTLWDSSSQVAASWNQVLCSCEDCSERMTTQRIQSLMGKRMEEIAELIFKDVCPERRTELMRACCVHENSYLRETGGLLYPALEQTLAQLCDHYQLMIVSNCQDGYIETCLEHYQFGRYFSDWECSGRTGRCKGDNIVSVIKRNQLKHSFYVGDTGGDAEAAQRAGIPFVFAAYGFGQVEAPRYRIEQLQELPAVAEAIFAQGGCTFD